jgi:hypothetical protein
MSHVRCDVLSLSRSAAPGGTGWHETARVRHAARRRGGGVAARVAATNAVGSWVGHKVPPPEPCKTSAMSLRAIPAPLWFVAALVPMVVSQIVRLEQSDPATWIAWDYAGRFGALAVLGAIPSARTVAFQWERLRITYWKVAAWIVGIVLVDRYVCGWIRRTLNTALPTTVLGGYPETHGWLHVVDVVFGLALVAYSEEIVFRRCARYVFQIQEDRESVRDGGPGNRPSD